MTDIIDLASRRRAAWGAQVTIFPWPVGEARAELEGFWGSDGRQAEGRCRMYAAALRRLADELDETASMISGDFTAAPSGLAAVETEFTGLADPKPEPSP